MRHFNFEQGTSGWVVVLRPTRWRHAANSRVSKKNPKKNGCRANMAASLVRFVRGGLGRSFNSKMTKYSFEVLYDVCWRGLFNSPCRRSPLKTTLSHFQPSNVSGLTFELANANVALVCTELNIGQLIMWEIGLFRQHKQPYRSVFSGYKTSLLLFILGVFLSLYQILCSCVVSGVNSVFILGFWLFPLVFSSSCKDFMSPPAAEQAAELHRWD